MWEASSYLSCSCREPENLQGIGAHGPSPVGVLKSSGFPPRARPRIWPVSLKPQVASSPPTPRHLDSLTPVVCVSRTPFFPRLTPEDFFNNFSRSSDSFDSDSRYLRFILFAGPIPCHVRRLATSVDLRHQVSSQRLAPLPPNHHQRKASRSRLRHCEHRAT